MTWITDKPTAPGWYWVATPYEWVAGRFDVSPSFVSGGKGKPLEASVPGMDYSEPLDDERWDECLWQGPIEAPAAPGVSR